jgi:hypothetical protein
MSSTAILRFAGLACTAILAGSVPSSIGSAPSIQRIATLRTARAAHTVTRLHSGQVLVAGGMADGGAALGSAELFDPLRNAVQPLPDMAVRRIDHTATLLGDGRVLVAGGYNGEYLASLEIFDPATRRFQPAGSLTEGRSGHTATLLADGHVLFVGGVGRGWTFLRSAEVYDPVTGRSERVGSLSVPRESHTATLLEDGRVLITGGHAGRRQNMQVYASAEVFAPQSRRFELAGALVTARHKHDAIRLTDGRVLIIGGADRTDRNYFTTTEIYDPRTARFDRGPSMANRRYKIAGTSVLLPDGKVLVTSGARTAEILDVGSGTFREVPGRLTDAYRFAAATPLRGDDVLITGGYSDSNENTAGVWRFRQQ